MHKYKVLFFSLLLLLCACGGNSMPDDVIKPDRMASLLTQVHLADGAMYNVMQLPDSLYKYGTDRYLQLFKSFHTDSVQFKKSMQYYSSNPELLVAIYDQVTISLKAKSDSMSKVYQQEMLKENKRKQDSLAKLPKQPPPPPHPVTTTPVKLPAGKFNNKRYIPPNKNAHPVK
jgi:Domain of unknown function (DUF4296)